MRRSWVLPLSVAGVALTALVARAEGKAALPDLSGHWRLNKDKSDDPQEKMRAARQGGRGGPGMSRPGMGGGRPRGGPGMGGPGMGGGRRGEGRGDGHPDPETLRQREVALAELTIEHEDPALTIADGNGQRRFYYTDGRDSRRDADNGESLQVKTRWRDGRVVVETRAERGTTTETYQLSAEGRELIVETRREGQGPMPAFNFKRVYDLVTDQPRPAGPPAPTPQQ